MVRAKILLIDDEEYVLKAVCHFFRDEYDVRTASGADAALQMLVDDSTFAAVVADLRMPGMSGIDFLRHAHEFAPHVSRILLTGQLDSADAMRAVNEGRVFQILMKPCPIGVMRAALEQAVCNRSNEYAQEQALQRSVRDHITKLLCDILAVVSPLAWRRATAIKELAVAVVEQLGIGSCEEIEIAALLSQFGCIDVPTRVLTALSRGLDNLTEAEAECFRRHSTVASSLLSRVPQLKDVARSIELQLNNFDGSGSAVGAPVGDQIPLPARILRGVIDYEMFMSQQMSPRDALTAMARQHHCYDPKVINAIKRMNQIEDTVQLLELNVGDIRIGMTLESAVGTTDGRTLLAKGSLVTDSMLTRLKVFASSGNLVEPILVSTPQLTDMATMLEVTTVRADTLTVTL